MSEFLVECPKCMLPAEVTSEYPFYLDNGKLTCRNCMHSEKAIDLKRYNAIIKRHCDECGNEFETTIPNQKVPVDEVKIPCPHCGTTRIYKPRNEEYRIGYITNGKAVDPIFSLPLWFQADIRGDLFWAYNREHLNEIKAYVSSKLRERQSSTHTTMVERLPGFIKDSKNREIIVKVIERLERKKGA
jgi:DNA-directed RNA polymerase subunit RPC12/RpoP